MLIVLVVEAACPALADLPASPCALHPPHPQPIIIEKLPWETVQELQGRRYAHAKHCYIITEVGGMPASVSYQVSMCCWTRQPFYTPS